LKKELENVRFQAAFSMNPNSQTTGGVLDMSLEEITGANNSIFDTTLKNLDASAIEELEMSSLGSNNKENSTNQDSVLNETQMKSKTKRVNRQSLIPKPGIFYSF
jgi:hypothetical protein